MMHTICAEVTERAERVQLWKHRTRKSQAAFYRRLAELESARNGPN